jgi:hypothetical protein
VSDGKHRPLPPRYAPNQEQITQKRTQTENNNKKQKKTKKIKGSEQLWSNPLRRPPPPLVGAVWRISTGHFRLVVAVTAAEEEEEAPASADKRIVKGPIGFPPNVL